MSIIQDRFKYESGEHSFGDNYGVVSSQVLPNNKVYGKVSLMKADASISYMKIRITNSVVGSIVMGVYKYTPETANKWTLIQQAPGTVDQSLILEQTLTFASPVDLKKGSKYCFAVNAETAGNAAYSIVYSTNEELLGYNNIQTTTYKNALNFTHVYDGTLPAFIAAENATAAGYTPLILCNVI